MDFRNIETRSGSCVGRPFTPKDLNGKRMDCSFVLYGPDSAVWARVMARRRQSMIERIRSNDDEKPRDEIAAAADEMADMVVGWDDKVLWDGAPLPFTRENVVMLLSQAPFLVAQFEEFIADRRNFTKPESPR